MKKVLIFHTSIGLGHKTMAENIGWHLERAGFEVKLADILEVQSGALQRVSTKIHSWINNSAPFIWSWLYAITNKDSLTKNLRISMGGQNSERAKKLIDEYQPDLIISTHTTSSAVVSYLKKTGQYKNLFAITFSDFHLHRYWLYSPADFYLANIEERKQEMIKLGIPADKIFVCGMTLKDKPDIDANQVKQRLEIPESNRVLLFSSGSLGIGSSAKELLHTISKIQEQVSEGTAVSCVIVCGKNKSLHDELRKLNTDTSTKILGYYTPMAELYAISDVFVTKPGGLSVSESLQWDLPLLITHWLPGQEELNYDYLSSRHLIMQTQGRPVQAQEIVAKVSEELSTQAFRTSLISNPSVVELIGEKGAPASVLKAIESVFHERLTDHKEIV